MNEGERRGWIVVALLWIAYFLNYTDRQLVFAIFPVLREQLRFTDRELGLAGSVFLWVYAFTSPVAGQIGDWIPKRTLVVLSLVLWSAATALTGMAQSPGSVLACRALIGVVEGLFMPAAIALAASAHAPGLRSRAVGVLSTAQLAGVVMGGTFGGKMAETGHWRWAFYTLGLVGLLFAAPFAAGLRRAGEGPAEEPRPSRGFSAAALVQVPSYLALCAIFPVFCFALWLVYTWLPDDFHERFHLSMGEAGFASTAYAQGATLVGMLAGGALGDRLFGRVKSARFWLLVGGLAVVAPCLAILAKTGSFGTAKMAAAGFGLGCGLFMANLFVSAFDVVPSQTRASAVGCLNLLGCLSSGWASYLGGEYRESLGIPSLMTRAAVACALGSLILAAAVTVFFRRDYERVRAPGIPEAESPSELSASPLRGSGEL